MNVKQVLIEGSEVSFNETFEFWQERSALSRPPVDFAEAEIVRSGIITGTHADPDNSDPNHSEVLNSSVQESCPTLAALEQRMNALLQQELLEQVGSSQDRLGEMDSETGLFDLFLGFFQHLSERADYFDRHNANRQNYARWDFKKFPRTLTICREKNRRDAHTTGSSQLF